MSFSDYLKSRETSFNQIKESFNKTNTFEDDSQDKIWKPKMGKDGTGFAVVRFLPGKDPAALPWVKMYDHGFQGPSGKWYIENSLTTLNEKDPVSEYNSSLWNNGTEAGKEQARKQKRRLAYYTNVLVIKDTENPQNEGKVMIYRFGQKIFEKIQTAMNPEFEGDDSVNPFDLFAGANFRIKIKTVAGYWNYDASDFGKSEPLSEDENQLEKIYNAQHDVKELVAPDKFKSYEDLQKRLNEVLGLDNEYVSEPVAPAPAPAAATSSNEEVGFSVDEPSSSLPSGSSSSDDEMDLEAYFKELSSS
jgi:hypothetical protein